MSKKITVFLIIMLIPLFLVKSLYPEDAKEKHDYGFKFGNEIKYFSHKQLYNRIFHNVE